MTPEPTCYAHPDTSERACPDCVAISNSLYLRMVRDARASLPTPDEMGRPEDVAERFTGPEGWIRAAGYAVRITRQRFAITAPGR